MIAMTLSLPTKVTQPWIPSPLRPDGPEQEAGAVDLPRVPATEPRFDEDSGDRQATIGCHLLDEGDHRRARVGQARWQGPAKRDTMIEGPWVGVGVVLGVGMVATVIELVGLWLGALLPGLSPGAEHPATSASSRPRVNFIGWQVVRSMAGSGNP